MSKERAAKIANSPGASKKGGEESHSGSGKSQSKQGGTTAQRKEAGTQGRSSHRPQVLTMRLSTGITVRCITPTANRDPR